jgi:hypothetical protein
VLKGIVVQCSLGVLDIIRGSDTLLFLLAEHNYTARLCEGLKHVNILFIIMQKCELLKLLIILTWALILYTREQSSKLKSWSYLTL